jgi:hypothetical protein
MANEDKPRDYLRLVIANCVMLVDVFLESREFRAGLDGHFEESITW